MSTKAKKKPKFDIPYFLNKFGAIPGNKWITGELREGGKCCALGWCGVKGDFYKNYKCTREAKALGSILSKGFGVTPTNNFNADLVIAVNDANSHAGLTYDEILRLGKTPRTRILNALKKCQKLEQAKAKS